MRPARRFDLLRAPCPAVALVMIPQEPANHRGQYVVAATFGW